MHEEVPALARLAAFIELNEDELRHLVKVSRPPRTLAAKTILHEEGAEPTHCYILLEGWVGSYTTSRDGHRSMTKVHMVGDLMGNTSLPFREAAETLVTLCPVKIAGIPISAIGSLFLSHSRLSAVLYLIAQQERVHQMDRTSSLLRLNAHGRIAALLLDLRDRFNQVAKDPGNSFDFHLTQYDIADLTGLTTVHTNRIIQQFRQDNLIHLRRHHLTILDEDRLEDLADRPQRSLVHNPAWLPGLAH